MALAERDVRLALGIVEAAAAGQNGSPFGTELLTALLEAIPALNLEYAEWRFHEPPTISMACPFDLWDGLDEVVAAYPRALDSYPLRAVDCASSDRPLRITDFVSQREFRKTPCYTLLMRPFGVEHELKLFLPAPPGHCRYFGFYRERGKNFDDRDVALLGLVRPHLARLRARWERAPRPAQLTERECDVLELVAQGLTNREVAAGLFISTSTVRTHLEHVFEKLGVRTRAGAVAAAFRRAS
jgi:DNA-binding CsgD family transcriptional regulator